MPESLTSTFQASSACDDLIGIVLAEGDAPAVARELGQVLMVELDPAHRDVVVLVLLEGEVLAAVLGREPAEPGGAQGLQAQPVQALDRLHLEQRVARQDQQTVVLDVVDLGAAVLPADVGTGIVEQHPRQRQVDLLLLALPAQAARGDHPRAVQVEHRHRAHLLPLALAQGLGQLEGGGTGLQLLADQAGDGGRHGRAPAAAIA